MALSALGLRLLAGLIGLGALASLDPAAAEGKLTKPERRAVDISSVSGASTSSAVLAEISFAGKLGDALGRGGLRRAQVKVELLTASGPAAVITEGGVPRRPRQGRTGTVGAVQVVREARGLTILAEGLPAAIRRVVVSTGTGAAVAAREVVFDQADVPIRVLDYQGAIDLERQRVQDEIASTERELERWEEEAERYIEKLDKAQRRVNQAETQKEFSDARADVMYWKGLLESATRKRQELRMKLRQLRRWHEILGQIRIIVILPLSSRAAEGG